MKSSKSLLDHIKESLQAGDTRLPALSPTAMKMQSELAREEPDLRTIEKLVIQDQALTSQILKLANSAFYKGLQTVDSIQQALIRLGLSEVTNLVTLVTQKANYHARDPQMQELLRVLWRHSVACAFGAKWLAKKCGFNDLVQDAFLAGLLHDIGSLFIATVIDDIREQGKIKQQIAPSLIQEVVHTLHPRLGHSVMKAWNLPDKFCTVARDHHKEEFDSKNYLLTVVRLADKTCNKLNIGNEPATDIMLTATQECLLLGLSEVDIAELEVRLEDAAGLIQNI